MNIDKHWLISGVAVVAALGVGFGASQLLNRQEHAGETHAEADEDHGEETGSPEGFVPLTATAAAAAGVTVTTVTRGGGGELMLPGRVAFTPGAEALVDAPLAGAVVEVHVAPGASVRAGAPLVTMRSPEGAASRASVDVAAAGADAARAAARRDRQLFERGYVARARLEITEAEARRAEAELRAARARTRAYGSPADNGLVVVRSPTAGVVTRLLTAQGSFLDEERDVAAVANASRIELSFEAPPAAAGLLSIGSSLEGRTPDGQSVTGIVTAIVPAGAGGMVTVRARPTGFAPPAGTVISARLRTGQGGGGALVVPAEAVQTVEGVPSVFVSDGRGFQARPVVTGRTAAGMTEVTRGLSGSERIAGAGAFLLKAELAKGEAEHGH